VLGGTAEDVAFAEGMHDELLHRLAKIGGIRVTSRTSVLGIREQLGLSRDIAEALGVRYLVEATAQRYGDRVRIIVQVIDPVSDDHMWSETYTATFEAEDLFALQAEISTAIASELATSLTSSERERLAELPTRNLEAYMALQRANASFWRRFFLQARADAAAAYREAIELDPRFVDAHAQLARVLALSFWFGQREAAEEAWSSVRTALILDSASAATHRAMGDVLYYTLRDYGAASRHYERVLALEPSDVETLAQLGLMLNRRGRTV